MYLIRHGKVFYRNSFGFEWVQQADIASFRVLSDFHARDKNYAYYEGEVIEGALANSFSVVGDEHSKDAQRLFECTHHATWSNELDVPTFEQVGGPFFRDRNGIYCIYYSYDTTADFKLDADPRTFRALPGEQQIFGTRHKQTALGLDKDQVFNHQRLEPDLCAKSLVSIHPFFIKDDNDVYFLTYGGKHSADVSVSPLHASPGRFSVLDENYASDDRQVFYYYNCQSVARDVHIECRKVSTSSPANFMGVVANPDGGLGDFAPDAYDGSQLFLRGYELPLGASEYKLRTTADGVVLEYVNMDRVHRFVYDNFKKVVYGDIGKTAFEDFGGIENPTLVPPEPENTRTILVENGDDDIPF